MIADHTYIHYLRIVGVGLYALAFGLCLYAAAHYSRAYRRTREWVWGTIAYLEASIALVVASATASRMLRAATATPPMFLDYIGVVTALTVLGVQWRIAVWLRHHRKEDG